MNHSSQNRTIRHILELSRNFSISLHRQTIEQREQKQENLHSAESRKKKKTERSN
jgi:hypothetical protein